MNKELLNILKGKFEKRGFIFKKIDGNYYFTKDTQYSFQKINIVIFNNCLKTFHVSLEFELILEDGLSFYLKPFLKERTNDNTITIGSMEGAVSYSIMPNKHMIKCFSPYSDNINLDWVKDDLNHFFIFYDNELVSFISNMLKDYPRNIMEETESLFIKALIFEQLKDKKSTSMMLKDELNKLKYLEEYERKRYLTYINYLENDIPLSDIQDSEEKTSILQLTGNDIYISFNRKIIKDSDMLKYFGGIKNFDKPQKISYEDLNNDNAIAISKAGKWSILRIGVDSLMKFDQETIENMLSDMSVKYNRAILCVHQDTTNTFGFEVYKKGEFLRRWMAGDGEVLENVGKPITGEKKRFSDTLKNEQDVQSVVEFLDSVLKITYGDLEKSKTVLYEMK